VKTVPSAGLYETVSESEYHADCAPDISLSRGIAVTLLTKSPLHAWLCHPKLGGADSIDNPTAEMDFGAVGHKLLLGKGANIQVGEWDDWRKNEAKEWRKTVRASGQIAILQHTYERALRLEEEARKEFARLGIAKEFEAGKSEVVAVWQEDGHWLRVMLDRLCMEGATATIYDVKIVDSANPGTCERQIASMRYDVQWAMYQRGLHKIIPGLAGRTRFIFLFIESEFPFSVTPMELNGEFAMLGEKGFDRAFAKWKECRASNVWPPYTANVLRAAPPGYMVNEELKREFENQ
jgi:hypothetical protein